MVDAAIQSLLEAVEKEPYPALHTNPYWREEGERLVIRREGERIFLRGYGIGLTRTFLPIRRLVHAVQRMTYRKVIRRLRSYPSVWRSAKGLANDLGCALSFDFWKSAMVLSVLADHWEDGHLQPRTFAVIGDGPGFLSTLIRRRFPKARIYCIDLPKALVFQAEAHRRTDRAAHLARLGSYEKDSAVTTLVLPQEVEGISELLDCAVNMASMQEMNGSSVAAYFAFLRSRSGPHSRFYCINRLEKELPDGEWRRFEAYPWDERDEVFIHGPCPYYSHFFAPYTTPQGPRLWGVRIPFVNGFDGPMFHRLVHLAGA